MSRGFLISIGLVVVFAVGLFSWIIIDLGDEVAPTAREADRASLLVRPDSHRLSSADSPVTFVEFLDFECEACGAMFPNVERLRNDYAGRVNFVVRYFPLPGHFNAERAARAVEAAAQQGRFEAMYKKMFDTQRQWGEQRVPADETFRGFASAIGLDLAAFDIAYRSPATLERVNADVRDGKALGVQGTPTIYVNGEQLDASSYADLTRSLDDALAR